MTPDTLEYTLRPCEADDLPALCDLHEACFRPLVETRFEWDPDVQRQRFVDDDGGPATRAWAVLVACELAGQLVVEEREDALFVKRIMVHPRWQGRRLGTRLLEELIERARARGLALTLSVWDTNRARALYERLGFRRTEQVEHRVRMRLDP